MVSRAMLLLFGDLIISLLSYHWPILWASLSTHDTSVQQIITRNRLSGHSINPFLDFFTFQDHHQECPLCWPWIPATRTSHCINDPIELEQIGSMTGWETTEWQQQRYDGDTGMCILKCCVSWSDPIPSVPVIDHPIAYRCGCGGGFLVYVSCLFLLT